MVIALLARFPSWRAPSVSHPVIPADAAQRHPELAADLADLDREVTAKFTEYDRRALRAQHSHRRQQVLALLGSAVVTAVGGVQALLPEAWWPGAVLAIAGVLLATSSQWARERGSLQNYPQARLQAERLRSVYFRYLARTGPYAGQDRTQALRRAVLAVDRGREPQ